MANRYALNSYPDAESRMRTNGHIFDVGQIAPSVMSQLYAGVQLGIIKVSRDSWPFRGMTIGPDVQVRTVFEFVTKQVVETHDEIRSRLLKAAADRGFVIGNLMHGCTPITLVAAYVPGAQSNPSCSSMSAMTAACQGNPFVLVFYGFMCAVLDDDMVATPVSRPKAVKAPAKTVHVLVIDNESGLSATVHEARESADAALLSYVKDNWVSSLKDALPEIGDKALIAHYFDMTHDRAEIIETTVSP